MFLNPNFLMNSNFVTGTAGKHLIVFQGCVWTPEKQKKITLTDTHNRHTYKHHLWHLWLLFSNIKTQMFYHFPWNDKEINSHFLLLHKQHSLLWCVFVLYEEVFNCFFGSTSKTTAWLMLGVRNHDLRSPTHRALYSSSENSNWIALGVSNALYVVFTTMHCDVRGSDVYPTSRILNTTCDLRMFFIIWTGNFLWTILQCLDTITWWPIEVSLWQILKINFAMWCVTTKAFCSYLMLPMSLSALHDHHIIA